MNLKRFSRAGVTLVAGMSLISAGCASVNNFYGGFFKNQGPQPVAPSQFVQRTPGNEPPQSSPLPPESNEPPTASSEQPVPPVTPPTPPPANPPEVNQPGGISKVVQNAIQPGGNPALAAPSTQPATQPAVGLAAGQFINLGLVVANVGGIPIFANQVLRPLAAELRNDARTETLDQFISAASDLVQRQIIELEIYVVNYEAATE